MRGSGDLKKLVANCHQPQELPSPHGSAVAPARICADAQVVVEVRIDELRLGFSPRSAPEDPAHISMLAQSLDKLPPILVHRQTMTVIDGAHRLLAAKLAARRRISARLFEGTVEEARLEAIRTNIAHGRPLTAAERDDAAATTIANHPEWSDRRIAEICGLSPRRIARLRSMDARLTARVERTAGRDGKLRPTDPAAQRRRIAELLHAHPQASVRAIALEAGTSQATVRDVRRRILGGKSPVPARLGHPDTRTSHDGRRLDPKSEHAYNSTTAGAAFAQWFDERGVRHQDCHLHIAAVPLSRVYQIAEECRERAQVWLRFAELLEGRAQHQGSSTNHE